MTRDVGPAEEWGLVALMEIQASRAGAWDEFERAAALARKAREGDLLQERAAACSQA